MLDKKEDIKIIDNLEDMTRILLIINEPYYVPEVTYNIKVGDRIVTGSNGFLE